MIYSNETIRLIKDQCARYPDLQIGDLLKALYQSTQGCGHLVKDPSAAAAYIKTEAETVAPADALQAEPLGNRFCRLHLNGLAASGLSAETLAALFALSAQSPGDSAALGAALDTLLELARSHALPFPYESVSTAVEQWRKQGMPPVRHTEAFRSAYAPAYRVLNQDLLPFLPLFIEIDRALQKKGRLLVAIEGGAAAGKSTLGTLLQKIYDCNLFHMDDFFLRPEQRTPERFRQAGGNIDHERFREEVLLPLTQGSPVSYRRFDCRTFQIQPPVEILPNALNIVEGAYSCHPCLSDAYDLKVFLKIDPQTQAERIRKRNDSACQARFFETWLPLERTYFDTLQIETQCDLILEVNP